MRTSTEGARIARLCLCQRAAVAPYIKPFWLHVRWASRAFLRKSHMLEPRVPEGRCYVRRTSYRGWRLGEHRPSAVRRGGAGDSDGNSRADGGFRGPRAHGGDFLSKRRQRHATRSLQA